MSRRAPTNANHFFKVTDASTYTPEEFTHVQSRSTVKVLPQHGSVFRSDGSTLIRFTLPSTGFLDCQNSFLSYMFQSSTMDKDGNRVMGGLFNTSGTPFARMRLMVAGQTVEDIRGYNMLNNTLTRATVPKDLSDSFAGEELGFYGSVNNQNHYLPVYRHPVDDEPILVKYASDIYMADSDKDPTLTSGDLINNLNEAEPTEGSSVDNPIPRYNQESEKCKRPVTTRPIFKPRQRRDCQNGRTYYHNPMLGLLNNSRYLPLSHLGEVVLEITLDSYNTVIKEILPATYEAVSDPGETPELNKRALETDASLIPTQQTDLNALATDSKFYTLSDVGYHVDILQFDDAYLMAFEASLAERSIHIPYVTCTNYTYPLSSQSDIMVQHRSRNVKSMFLLPRVGGLTEASTHNSFMSAGARALAEVQVRIGAYQKPLQPIRTSSAVGGALDLSRAWAETMKALSLFGNVNHAPALDSKMYRYGGFFMALDFEREGGSSSGIDTASESTPIILSIKCDHELVGRTGEYGGVKFNNVSVDVYVVHQNTLIMSGAHEVAVFT
eukprot:CFRG8236T1